MQRLISKTLRWEAAHRLFGGYPGNCRFVHGHSYVATVAVQLRPDKTLDQFGFVKDFYDFKPLKEWIDETLDHATMVFVGDTPLLRFLIDNDQKRYVFSDGNPSAENIAKHIFDMAVELLQDENVEVYEVRVNETCSSEAIHRK